MNSIVYGVLVFVWVVFIVIIAYVNITIWKDTIGDRAYARKHNINGAVLRSLSGIITRNVGRIGVAFGMALCLVPDAFVYGILMIGLFTTIISISDKRTRENTTNFMMMHGWALRWIGTDANGKPVGWMFAEESDDGN